MKRKASRAPHKSFLRLLGHSLGIHAICQGWLLLRMPLDVVRRRRKSGPDPQELGNLDFAELLQRWQIPAEKLPRIKRVLMLEMAAYALVACLALSNPVLKLIHPGHSMYAAILGFMVGLIAALQFVQRLHWYLILARGRYQTLAEFLRSMTPGRG